VIECLDQAERTRLQELRVADPFVDEALHQLERILTSQRFARVQRRTKDFLTLVLTKKLLGQAHQIKETTIAIAVFHESAAFDPMTSSKVRVAASDLRQRLGSYYVREGQSDPIEIMIPIATYVPEIRDRRIFVAVNTFENWHPLDDQHHLCPTLADDIVYLLNRDARFRATRTASTASEVRVARYLLRGSLEPRAGVLRLNVSLADLSTRCIVFCRSFTRRRNDAFVLTLDVAKALSKVLGNDDRPSARGSYGGGEGRRGPPVPPNTVPERPSSRQGASGSR
jgi:TolB-like protein